MPLTLREQLKMSEVALLADGHSSASALVGLALEELESARIQRAEEVCEFLHQAWGEDQDLSEWPWDGIYELYAQWREVAHPEWTP